MKREGSFTSDFLRGSVILSLSAVIAKVCGALFRIPLTALLGGVGMGYFSTAYGLFLPLYAVLVTGISTAAARLTADRIGRGDADGAAAVRRISRLLFAVSGTLGTILACLGAKGFTHWSAGSPEAYPAVLAICPAVLFCSLSAVERGCCEGTCHMLPTALSQAFEGLCRVIAGLWLCRAWMEQPPALLGALPREAAGACGAVLGVTLSAAAGWLWMLCCRVPQPPHSRNIPVRPLLRELLRILLPAALGALITNLTTLIDLLTVMRLLPDGDPAFVYGSFMGLSVTVFGLVPSLTNMLARSVLPCTAQAWAAGDRKGAAQFAQQVIWLTGLLAVPAACGIFVLPEGCLQFLFAGREAEIAAAYPSLRLLMPGLVGLCLVFPVFSLMQAAGREDLPVKLMLPGLCVKLAGNLLLLPRIGIEGAALSASGCYLVILLPALVLLRRVLGEKLHIGKFLLCEGFAGMLCGAAAWSVYGYMAIYPQRIAFLCAVTAGAGVYVGAMVLLCGKELRGLLTGKQYA